MTEQMELPFSDGQEGIEEDLTSPEAQRLDQAAERVRLQYKGVRVTISGLSSRRGVSETVKKKMAEAANADVSTVSGSTLLWPKENEAIKALRSVYGSIGRSFYDRTLTLPTVHDGLRLIKKDCVGEFNRRMKNYQVQLAEKAEVLKRALPAISRHMQEVAGDNYDPAYYEFDPTTLCKVKWYFPSVMEDRELAEIDDEVYQEDIRRVRRELHAVVLQKEEEMAEALYGMLDRIVERLSGETVDGKAKTFRDATVNGMFDELDHITEQLKENGIGGAALEAAAKKIKAVLRQQGKDTLPEALRGNASYRDHVREKCAKIADYVLKQAVPKKRRAILRQKSEQRRVSEVLASR